MKRHCSTRWIENHDAVFVSKELYPVVAGSLDQLSKSRDDKVVGRAMSYYKAITTAGFLVSLKVINAILPNQLKKGAGYSRNYFDCVKYYCQLQRCDRLQAFRDNEEFFLDYSDMPKVSMGTPCF